MIQYLLIAEKIWNSAKINLSSTLNFYQKIFSRHDNIHREIDQWNGRRFGAKWNVTVPNSVTPIKHIACQWKYISQGWYCQMPHELCIYIHTYTLHYIFVKLWFGAIFKTFIKFCSFLSFGTTGVKHSIWNQHILGQCSCCIDIEKNSHLRMAEPAAA